MRDDLAKTPGRSRVDPIHVDLFHVDVFASGPLSGNGLAVVLGADGWAADFMQCLTREMRQFESIFLSSATEAGASARVFTVEEELPFAGHPVLGAAAVLHRVMRPATAVGAWTLALPSGPIHVTTRFVVDHWQCEMDQGIAEFVRELGRHEVAPVLSRLGLGEADLAPGLPPAVVSTGLPYLILPVTAEGLARGGIVGEDFEQVLGTLSAKFVLLLDPHAREMRTWDNLGKVEDVATGSAAGPAAAYLVRHGRCVRDAAIDFAQGRFVDRPSRLRALQLGDGRVLVGGDVWPVSRGTLEQRPRTVDPPRLVTTNRTARDA